MMNLGNEKTHKKVGHFPQGNVSYKKGEMRMLLCSILISPKFFSFKPLLENIFQKDFLILE